MAKRTPQDWETVEWELHAAEVAPEEIEAGAHTLLSQARTHQLAEARKQLGLAQRDIAAAIGVSIARVSQIEHGAVTSFEVIARYVEALGGPLDLVADFGDAPSGYQSATPQ
jgi:ribosome-binding protein aMBF1 (putative translation factor)